VIWPFGKFAGQPVEGTPQDYLVWAAGRDLREPLRSAVGAALRACEPPPTPSSSNPDRGHLSAAEVRQTALALIDAGQRVHAIDAERPDRVHAVRIAAWVRELVIGAPTTPRITRGMADSVEDVTRRRQATRDLLERWARTDTRGPA
jgi:hypothetical protein